MGKTLYVSKLGHSTDGLSWENAFTTIQKALDSVPDDKGGYRIIIRPDTYMEAMLAPAFKGAKGAYNELIGDIDGKYGSGTTGYAVIDSGDRAKASKATTGGGPSGRINKGGQKNIVNRVSRQMSGIGGF